MVFIPEGIYSDKGSKKAEVLELAINTVKDRGEQYGDAFEAAAALWSAYDKHRPGETESPEDVAVKLLLLKVARICTGRKHEDNYVDIAGYAACAAEIAVREETDTA